MTADDVFERYDYVSERFHAWLGDMSDDQAFEIVAEMQLWMRIRHRVMQGDDPCIAIIEERSK